MKTLLEFTSKKGRKVKIRFIMPEDIDSLWDIYNQVIAEKIFLPAINQVTSPIQKKRWFVELDEKASVVLVAVENEYPLGYLTLEMSEQETSEHVSDLGILVRKEYRNEGIGAHLIRTSIKVAKERKYEKICLSSFNNNEPAKHLYQKLGFKLIGLRRNQFKLNSNYQDELLMDLYIK
ncbi:MAG: GNAT family N-acetyltransferase [Candidatus Ranarchaeia archaeon]